MFGEQREAGNGVIKINLKNKQKPKSQSEANKSQLLKKRVKTLPLAHMFMLTHILHTLHVCACRQTDTHRDTQE